MKSLIILCVILFTHTLKAASTNYVWNTFSPELRNAIKTTLPSFPSQLVLEEGLWSNDYSSVRYESDYFAIPTTSTNGGRLLRMTPFTTSDYHWWYGIDETNAVFTDVLSREVFKAELTRTIDPITGAQTHVGTLIIDDRYLYILVTYHLSIRYPTTMLTWGIGATYGFVGIEIDKAVIPPDQIVIPTNHIADIHLVSNERGSVGAFILLGQPFHSGHQIEESSDLATWSRINKSLLLISGDGRRLFYDSGEKKQKFFRLMIGP